MDAEFESHSNGDSAPFDEVPSLSENCPSDENIDDSIRFPELGNQFIKRSSPHEDIMDEINSTFKFAKMEIPQFCNKSVNIKSNEPSITPPGGSDIAKDAEALPQRRFSSRPASDLASDKSLDEASEQLNIQGDPELSMLTYSATHPTIIVGSSSPSSATRHKPDFEVFADSMAQDEPRLVVMDLVDQEIDGLNTGSAHQPTPSSEGDVLCSKSVLGSETSSRRSQSAHRATFNTEIRIKHPFPEVAQSTPDGNDEAGAPLLGREPSKSAPNFSGRCPTHYTIPPAPAEDEALRPKVSIAQCPDSQASGSSVLPQSTSSISLTDNTQQAKQQLGLVEWRPEAKWRQREGLSLGLSSSTQTPRGRTSDTDLLSLESHEEISTGTNISETLTVDRTTSNHPDNHHSTLETQVLMDSVQRPSSSCSQLIVPIPVNAPKIGDKLRRDFASGHITTNNYSSVQKSKNIKETHSYSSATSDWPPLLSNVILAQQNLIRHSQEVKDILNDYQFQKETVQVQQSELEYLKASTTEKSKEIQTLEAERASLKSKIKKMELLSIKYKNHMNEVVIAQKNLMRESLKIQKVQIDAKLFQTSYDSRDEHIKKLESLLHEAREFRAPAQTLLAIQNENGHLLKLVQESSKINELLQSDLDKNAIELGRERHNVSQLQKQLNMQIEAHQELIGNLKTVRCDIVEDLTNESGMLMTILRSGDSIQEKIKQTLGIVESVKSCGEALQQASAAAPENISVEMERILKATESNHGSLQGSQLQHFVALEAKVDQLHHDQKTASQLNTVISDLRDENATLSSNLRAREDKCQDLTKQIDGLKLELDNSRSLFSTKCDELTAASTSSRENSFFQLRCQDLERENRSLQHEVDAVNHKTVSIMEELTAVRNTSLETERGLHELSRKYSDAQTLIKEFPEEKKAYMSNAKLDVEKARQEVAKASMAVKAELIMRNDALVKILEQRRVEAELQVVTIREELKQMQDDRDRLFRNNAQLQDELFTCREESIRHAKHFEQLETQSLDGDALRQQETALKCALVEIMELKKSLDHIQKKATESLQTAIQTSQEVKTNLLHANDLEQQKESLKEQNILLQTELALLSVSTSRLTQAQGAKPGNESTARARVSFGMSSNNSKEADEELTMEISESGPDTTLTSQAIVPTNSPQTDEIRQNGSQPITSEHISARFELENCLPSNIKQGTIKTSQLKNGSILASSDQREGEVVSLTPQNPLNQLKIASRNGPESNMTGSTTDHEHKPTYNLQESVVNAIHGITLSFDAHAEEITPFSHFSPLLLHSQSPALDVSLIIDDLEITSSQQEVHSLSAVPEGNERDASQPEHNQASKSRKWPKAMKTQPGEPIFGKYSLSYQPPNNNRSGTSTTYMSNEQASFTKERHDVPLSQKRTAAQKTPVTLKSALKKSATMSQPITDPLSISKVSATLKSVPSGRGVNKNQRRSGPELGYKRVASGQVMKLKSDSTDLNKSLVGVDLSNPSSQHQFTSLIEKSPLMPGPKRNDRKRSASSALGAEEGQNIAKAPRTSLRFKSSTVSVDKSPMVTGLQGDKPHTRRRQ